MHCQLLTASGSLICFRFLDLHQGSITNKLASKVVSRQPAVLFTSVSCVNLLCPLLCPLLCCDCKVAVLCCDWKVVPCCVVPCCAVTCCALLQCIVPCFACCAIVCCVALHHAVHFPHSPACACSSQPASSEAQQATATGVHVPAKEIAGPTQTNLHTPLSPSRGMLFAICSMLF